ncbi:MAG: sigma-70 family RNA polymerase sigma factor [Bacilli bacterium]
MAENKKAVKEDNSDELDLDTDSITEKEINNPEELSGNEDTYNVFLKELDNRPQLSNDDILKMLKEYRANPSIDLRNEIVENNLRLVIAMSKQYAHKLHVPIMDLIQEGSMGLMNAVENFDLSKGYAFSTFAVPYIKNSIRRYLSDKAKLIRLPPQVQTLNRKISQAHDELFSKLEREPSYQEIAKYLGNGIKESQVRNALINQKTTDVYSFDYQQNDNGQNDDERNLYDQVADYSQNPSQITEENDRVRLFDEALETLPARDREIFIRRKGLYQKPQTLKTLADDYHLSLERVRQIEVAGEKKINNYLKKNS